jgi:hypothetical protein
VYNECEVVGCWRSLVLVSISGRSVRISEATDVGFVSKPSSAGSSCYAPGPGLPVGSKACPKDINPISHNNLPFAVAAAHGYLYTHSSAYAFLYAVAYTCPGDALSNTQPDAAIA